MREEMDAIAQRHGILPVLRFGSSVTGKAHARSDVDIAILLDRPTISLRDHAELLHDIQRLFPGQEVDVAVINHADPLFLKKITEHCAILHGPIEHLHRLKIYAFKRYQDHRRYFELERRFAAGLVANRPRVE